MSRKTSKLIWSVPLVAVFAVIGALAIFAAQVPGLVSAHGMPGAVTGVTATADGATKIKISWTAPASGSGGDPSGYRIDVSDDTLVWTSLIADTESTVTSYTHPGLKPETTKFYRVFALNSAGTGPSSIDPLYDDATTGAPTAPSAVLSLRANAMGSSKITLSWSAPASDGNAEIELYCIVADNVEGINVAPVWPTGLIEAADVDAVCTAGTEDGIVTGSPAFETGFLIVVNGKKTTYDLTQTVAVNQQWRFRAYAKNSAGMSSVASNIARANTAATADTGKPTDVRIVPVVTVTEDTDTVNDPTTVINETVDDASYVYTQEVNVYWNWPVSDGKLAANIGGFQWQWREKPSGGTWSAWPTTLTTSNTETFDAETGPPSGLTPQDTDASVPSFIAKGAQYQVRVRAVRAHSSNPAADDLGAGGWVVSNVITHQGLDSDRETLKDDDGTDVRTALTPVRLPGPATELKADQEKSLNLINMTWKRGPNATYSSIDVSDDNIKWIRLERNTKWARETYNHRNLKPETMLYYRVTPGHSTWGFGLPATAPGSTKKAVVPTPVRGLTVTANGQDMLDLSWPLISAANDGGSAIVGYLIQVNEDQDATLQNAADGWDDVNAITVSGATVTDGAGGGSYTYAEGLTAGSIRWFRVFAVNDVNKGGPTPDDESSAEPKMGKTASPVKPGAPQYLVAETARDSNSEQRTELGVDLLWDQGDLASGDTIMGYVVDRKVNDGDWEQLSSSPHTGDDYTQFTDTEEPKADEQRAYRVAAVASGGQGAWSNVAYNPAMHTVDTSHNTSPMTVGTISDVTVMVGASKIGTMAVSSYFSDADAGDTLEYIAKSSDDAIATAEVNSDGMIVVTGVAAGTATITVTATDAAGAYAMQTFMVTVEAADVTLGVPGGVMTSDATENPGTLLVKVDWTPGDNAVGHLVMLFTDDWQGAPMVEGMPTGNSHTFTVDAGSYIAVVVAYDADANIELAISGVTSVGGS